MGAGIPVVDLRAYLVLLAYGLPTGLLAYWQVIRPKEVAVMHFSTPWNNQPLTSPQPPVVSRDVCIFVGKLKVSLK